MTYTSDVKNLLADQLPLPILQSTYLNISKMIPYREIPLSIITRPTVCG